MTDDLKKRLNTMGATGWNPIGYEALERINQLEAERDQLREQVKMLRTDLKTAADYLDQTATCNSNKAISSQFRKTFAATEPKP